LQDNSEGAEPDPADCARRRCKKNSPFIVSRIGRKAREGCDRGSVVGTVDSGETGKGHFFRRNRSYLVKEKVVRVFVSKKSDGCA